MDDEQPVGEYLVEIIRKDMKTYEERVSNEEAGGSEFVLNSVAMLDGQLVNLAKFKTLDIGVLPEKNALFVELGKLPAGKAAEWTGVVLLNGVIVAASMYRGTRAA